MEGLEEILLGIRKETKHRLRPESLKAKGVPSFSKDPLTEQELLGLTTECEHGTKCSTYQLRALVVLDDKFHVDRFTGHRGVVKCVFEIPEYMGLFNEIHRAICYYVDQGLGVREALYRFLKSRKGGVRHEPAE